MTGFSTFRANGNDFILRSAFNFLRNLRLGNQLAIMVDLLIMVHHETRLTPLNNAVIPSLKRWVGCFDHAEILIFRLLNFLFRDANDIDIHIAGQLRVLCRLYYIFTLDRNTSLFKYMINRILGCKYGFGCRLL